MAGLPHPLDVGKYLRRAHALREGIHAQVVDSWKRDRRVRSVMSWRVVIREGTGEILSTLQEGPRGAITRSVLILAVHPSSTAATRLRATQYIPYLEAGGFDVALWTFLRDADVEPWFEGGLVSKILILLVGLCRLPSLLYGLLRSHVVMVQREVLPLGPPFIERFVARRKQLVWDVDDAVWFDPPERAGLVRHLRAPAGKFVAIAELADEIWAGSSYLASWCRQHNENVHMIPTTVEVPNDVPESDRDRTVVWIGSHTTGRFLESMLPSLREVQPPPRVIAVGSHVIPPEGLDFEVVAWSPEVERRVLSEARVGLYPVDREHPLAEGKCGLKAILYMANGVPPVVTPTSPNRAIVRHGIDGFHAESAEEWRDRVQRLLDDDALWEKMRRAGYARVRAEYSLQRWGPRVAARAEAVFTARNSPHAP